jgi:NAD(P)-dependent dehydrogenase (short-subunit alcohol dehydrogenase family)
VRLAGEIAIVTGSTAGLGKEIARVFAAEGASVVVTGRDDGRGRALVDEIAATGGTAAFVRADLSELAAADALVAATVERFGGVSVLVNNAVDDGSSGDGPLLDVDLADWERKLRVNLTGAAWLCRAVLPHQIAAGRGSIVNVSSRAAERGTPRLAAYTASKGGLNALTRSIAIDYASAGVRCNSVTPGYILHEERDRDMDDARRARVQGMHLTRLVTATDVALAVLFLASDESATITGIDLPVSGGSTTARGLTLG